MTSLFLIDRGKPGDNFTPPPTWRRVVVSDSSRVARRLAGDSADRCTVWQNFGRHNKGRGLLLVRWQGLDVDYGVALRPFVLPDGTRTGFAHKGDGGPWGLIPHANWWSSSPAPAWLVKLGVVLPEQDDSPNALAAAVAEDEASALPRETGTRPFGFRACAGWRELAASPSSRVALLPGMELMEV